MEKTHSKLRVESVNGMKDYVIYSEVDPYRDDNGRLRDKKYYIRISENDYMLYEEARRIFKNSKPIIG